jgi:hypothetical protein
MLVVFKFNHSARVIIKSITHKIFRIFYGKRKNIIRRSSVYGASLDIEYLFGQNQQGNIKKSC